jgi:hypothetical protein
VYADNDGNNGDGGDSDGNSNGIGNDATTAASSSNVDDNYGGDLRTAIGRWQFEDKNGTTTMYVNDDGNIGNGGYWDSKDYGDSKGNNAAATADGNNVNEDNIGKLRTTIGQR